MEEDPDLPALASVGQQDRTLYQRGGENGPDRGSAVLNAEDGWVKPNEASLPEPAPASGTTRILRHDGRK